MNKSIKYILLAVGFVALLLAATKGYYYLSDNYTAQTTQQQVAKPDEKTTGAQEQ